MKETFAKFGLNMNLYNPSAGILSNQLAEAPEKKMQTVEVGGSADQKIKRLLDMVPDYSFLLDTKLALP